MSERPLVSGVASFSTSALSVGSHTVSARYNGNDTFLPGNLASTSVNVIPSASLSDRNGTGLEVIGVSTLREALERAGVADR